MRLLSGFLLIAVLLNAGCSSSNSSTFKTPPKISDTEILSAGPKLKEQYAPEFIALLNSVDRVETYRLKHGDGPITRTVQGKSFDKTRAREVAWFLLQDDNFKWKDHFKCEPDFGFQIVLWSGKDRVEIDICFHCGQMYIRGFKAEDKEPNETASLDIWNVRLLAQWAKEALPDDPVIQKLYSKK